jgi:hypothetical protein
VERNRFRQSLCDPVCSLCHLVLEMPAMHTFLVAKLINRA